METRWSRRTVIHHGQSSSPLLQSSPNSPDPFVIFETQQSVSVTHWPRTSSMAPPRQFRRQPYSSSSLLPSFAPSAHYAFLDTTEQPALETGRAGNSSCGVPLPGSIIRWNWPVQQTSSPQYASWLPPTAHPQRAMEPRSEPYAEARSSRRNPSLNLIRRDVYTPKESDGNEDTKSCTVCLEDFRVGQQVMLTPCDHMFHEDCIVPWVERSDHCPVCRSTLSAPTNN
ncbi:uncharacterized protein LOC133815849 [Humulus lupulus]|uniref:uncharacterized protein LOC133815849 n=1 Tax=Humulus lupulus TaxID=3486 RepID=UPI002B409164|nr:uncharacterized protein LOC133815849 [Humulus lupulus]